MNPDKETRPESGGTGSKRKSIANSEYTTASQQVSWWTVHEYVQPLLDRAGSWPMAGTPAWCALDDDDPIKLAALLDAAQHHVLRVETAQAALAEASRAVSAIENWGLIGNKIRRRNEVYIPRRAS